jgi:hypothetical protein
MEPFCKYRLKTLFITAGIRQSIEIQRSAENHTVKSVSSRGQGIAVKMLSEFWKYFAAKSCNFT